VEIKFDGNSNPEIIPLEDDKTIGNQMYIYKLNIFINF
jgi:hypothetical protein